jgi:hypothetical protein
VQGHGDLEGTQCLFALEENIGRGYQQFMMLSFHKISKDVFV